MKTLWIKILVLFLVVDLFENTAFPIAANHGRIDIHNKSMQPYLLVAGLTFVSIIILLMLVYKRPSPKSGFYNVAKVVIPFVTILLIVNITGLAPTHLTFASLLIFVFHFFGILISLWLSIRFILNKALT